MTQEPSDLDKLFKKKLYTYEEAPLANSWEKISNRLPEQDKVRSLSVWYYAIAASLFVAMLSVFILFEFNQKNNNTSVTENTKSVSDDSLTIIRNKSIIPAPSTAVNQADHKKTTDSSIQIQKPLNNPKATSVLIATITKDTEKEVKLPDGSKAVLNRNSEIKYAENFADERIIYISGEVAFDVKEDPTHPFTVYGNLSKTVVLGTAFIIRSILDEKYDEINVTRGKVSFCRILENAERIVILAGNKGIIRSKDKKEKPELDGITDINYNAWLTDKIVFKDTKLNVVLSTLENYYDVSVLAENPEILNCRFTGSFERTHIDEILQVLSASFNLSFNKESKNYTLSGKGCK